MQHYYSEKPDIKSNRKEVSFDFLNKKFNITTDSGVFSKNKIDFGTELMLKVFINDYMKNGIEDFKFLDIGCGYGVVSLIVKTFFKESLAVLSDVNERALELSELNLNNHGIKNFKIIKSNLFDNINETFDVILSNPPIRAGKNVVFGIYEGAYEKLSKTGSFYCVIQTKQGAKSSVKKLKELFGNCETLEIEAGYRILKCVK